MVGSGIFVGSKKCWFVVGDMWCEVDVVCEEGGFPSLRRGDVGPRDEVRNQRKEDCVLVLPFWDRVVAVSWRIGDILEFSGSK